MNREIINKLEREDRIELRLRLLGLMQYAQFKTNQMYVLGLMLLFFGLMFPFLALLGMIILVIYEFAVVQKNIRELQHEILSDYIEVNIKPKNKKEKK